MGDSFAYRATSWHAPTDSLTPHAENRTIQSSDDTGLHSQAHLVERDESLTSNQTNLI